MEPSEKGPSILDLLKLERMWINEENEELEAIGRQRRKSASPKTNPIQHSHTPTRAPSNNTGRTSRHRSVGAKAQGPVIVLSFSTIPLTFSQVNEKYEVNTIYDPSVVASMRETENALRMRNVDRLDVPDTHRMSRSPSHRDKVQMKASHHMTGKPKSWSAEEYKEMKQYFMNWYMEVLKKQHEMEHTKVGKMPEREEWQKSPKTDKTEVV